MRRIFASPTLRQNIQTQNRRDEAASRLRSRTSAEFRALDEEFGADANRGLDEDQIEKNLETYGPNLLSRQKKKSLPRRLAEAFINPFTAILFVLALVSTFTDVLIPIWQGNPGDANGVTVIIILTMVTLSGALRFVQETRSGRAAEKLLAMITTTCTVRRQTGGRQEIPLEDLVVGDLIELSAGDMIPADIRILEAKDLFVSQSALTGESEPVEKIARLNSNPKAAITDLPNLGLMGSNVISGTAVGLVIATGDETLFGSIAKTITAEPVETSFTKGVNAVSWVLIRFMLVMVPIVFVLNGLTKENWLQAFLFAISIAVGLTPEMLPMIVTTSLAKGAISMSRKKVVVKNLNSIQNFGAIDILCTDKTGTLTQDHVVLQYHLDVDGNESSRVLRHAYLNSYFQTGYKNLMDLAIIERTEAEEAVNSSLLDLSEAYHKVDEIPFDFTRRRLSVIVEDQTGKRQLITKGAVEEMFSICTHVEYQGGIHDLTEELKQEIMRIVNRLNEDGMRVIALAQKTNPAPVGEFKAEDESGMLLIGYLAFLDPPKEITEDALSALATHGVAAKVLTGDNERVARCICRQVGLSVEHMLLGSDIEMMSDETLQQEAEQAVLFAKVSPAQKARIVTALRVGGHTVGFLGDGINDAPAMKVADIGISVDSAVDIAKESADIILLEKSLMVISDGIIEGRKTYANMIKYIKMTASSNFGNVFSVLAASALLPFLPMMSLHLILLNMIYDISCMAIPWDNVDEEFLSIPRTWDASSVGSFMLWMGPTSSVFDWTTYLIMYFIICPQFVSHGLLFHQIAPGAIIQSGALAGMSMHDAYVALFQAGWFVESMWSQTLVIHMIRTPKLPFIQSRSSLPLALLTTLGIAAVTSIPFLPGARALGFVALPPVYFIYLAVTILLYMALATSIKKAYIRRHGELL